MSPPRGGVSSLGVLTLTPNFERSLEEAPPPGPGSRGEPEAEKTRSLIHTPLPRRPMNFGELCACARCVPPSRKRRRVGGPTAPQLVATSTDHQRTHPDSVTLVPPPLVFLMERMPHIRCYCLYVRGARGTRLIHADVVVDGTSVVLICQSEPEDSLFGLPVAVSSAAACTELRLDTGETIDDRTTIACSVTDGYAYVRLPLAPEAARCDGRLEGTLVVGGVDEAKATAALDDGRASQQLREEAGLYHRAAAQRRLERASLCDAVLRCRRCGDDGAPLLHVERARALPDADVSSLVDFMQCCENLDFDWKCLFPEGGPASGDGAQRSTGAPARHVVVAATGGGTPGTQPAASAAVPVLCFLGTHSLHLHAPPPAAERALVDLSAPFAEPSCYRHTTSADGVGLWTPLRCAHCKSVLGAARLPQDDQDTAAGAFAASSPGKVGKVPVWFDGAAPPEFKCTLQLLKSAVVATGGGSAATDALGGYSMSTLLADRILRAAEEEEGAHTRRFVLAAAEDGPVSVLLLLLSPYVTLATNLATTAAACVAGLSTGGSAGGVTDALKVLYTSDEAAIAAAVDHGNAAAEERLVLPEAEERARVIAALHASTDMLPPAARRVGVLSVGYLPVAPTWD